MRQQFFNLTVFLRWQTRQHILEIGIGIMPIEPGALNQTHHRSGTLPGAQGAGKHPVVATNGDRANLVLNRVIVDGQLPIAQKLRQRRLLRPTLISTNDPTLLQVE